MCGVGGARSSAVVNTAIRRLVDRASGRPLSDAERRRYEQLVVEWAEAVRAEQQVAA